MTFITDVHHGWFEVRRCVKCNVELNLGQYAYSRGVCPHCGHTKGPHSTFCNVQTGVRRQTYRHYGVFWSRVVATETRWGD